MFETGDFRREKRRYVIAFMVPLLIFAFASCGGGGSDPTGTSAVPVATAVAGTGQATIEWNPVSGATSYNIYYSQTPGVSADNGIKIPGATSPRVVTPLNNGTAYYFVVTSVGANGESAESIEVSAKPMAAPTNVGASAGSHNATISWLPVTGASSYNIYYSQTPGVSTDNGIKVDNVTSPAVVTPLNDGVPYYFVVTAVNISGESAESAEKNTTPNPYPAPPAPGGVGVSTTTGYGQATVSWSPVAGATSYNLYYSQSAGLTKANGTKITNVTSPRTVTPLYSGKKYYFIVTAANEDAESADSTRVSATVQAVYVAVGDSITFGTGDDISSDNTSTDGKTTGGGFEPILANLLPSAIANEGVGGVSSATGASTIAATLAKYPSAQYFLIQYGSNDADTLGGPVTKAAYKANMQSIITAIVNAGKTPYLAKVPYTTNPRYDDPSIQSYNAAVDELRGTNGISVVAPDFYSWFSSHTTQLSDGLHPDGTGYQSMATMWNSALP